MGRNECGSNAMVTVQMTVEEYLEMKSRQDAKEVTSKQKNLVYGLEGIKTLKNTRSRILKKINKGIHEICDSLVMEPFTTYNIRHTYVSSMISKGATAEQMMSSDVPNDNETETIPSGIISAMNTEGKETPPENGHCSFKITLRSQNATVMRTNFHGLAIDNALVRLDFDKFLCSVCFDTKLQHNRKSCFHT